MSFDIFFQDVTADKHAVLPPERAAALSRVVQSYGGPAAPDEYGYFFNAEKAGSIELFAGKNDGAMLALRGWGLGKAAFAYDLLVATDWTMLVPDRELKFFAAREIHEAERAALADVEHQFVVLGCADDVSRAVEAAFGDWADYRDQVVKG